MFCQNCLEQADERICGIIKKANSKPTVTEPKQFRCQKCGGAHFGSDVEPGPNGQLQAGKMVTCQSVVSSKYIGAYESNTYCGHRCTREEAGL